MIEEIRTEISSLTTLKIMPKTSKKLYVHEFGFRSCAVLSHLAPTVSEMVSYMKYTGLASSLLK
jgi:hypothetical protein